MAEKGGSFIVSKKTFPIDTPLVSILIPTHNRPGFFRETLASVLQQTYANLEIIVSDDSTDDETEQLVRSEIHDPRVHYVHRTDSNMTKNFVWVLTHFHGKYFNLLMDDDLIAPEKIEMMVSCYEQFPHVSLVTSYRHVIDAEGNRINGVKAAQRLAEEPTQYSGTDLHRLLLERTHNLIGEPSTTLLRKKDLDEILPFWQTYRPNADILTWLRLTELGDAVYLPFPLSSFRMHAGQDQDNPLTFFGGVCDWLEVYLHEAERAMRAGDDDLRTLCWEKYTVITRNLVTRFWPETLVAVRRTPEDFATQTKLLSLEARYQRVLREYERIVFSMKEM